MPEREISREQTEAVRKWVLANGGSWVAHVANGESDFFRVGGEPLVMMWIREGTLVRDKARLGYNLYCSERHAQSLEKAEIVKFSLEP